MKKSIIYFVILVFSISLISCFPDIDEEPVEVNVEEESTFESSYNIYTNSTFYKINETYSELILNHKIGGWDLAFQSALEGDFVLINYTVDAKVIKTGTEEFSAVDKEMFNELYNSDDWKFNSPSFSNVKDSLALKDWESKEVYLVNRGGVVPPEESIYKIQFVSKTATSYTFKYANVGSSEVIEKTVGKDANYVNQYFSFETDDIVNFEPQIDNWDFFFTPYSGWYETNTPGLYLPYYLKGVMINNEGGVRVAKIDDENIAYEDIDLVFAQTQSFTDFKGVIGSTWKKIPDDVNPVYYMDTAKKYIVKSIEGKYFKLRFLDYYSTENAEVGFPSFEILLLE
ncbi:MAG: HmuY family protein [Bacteroidota bacterium]